VGAGAQAGRLFLGALPGRVGHIADLKGKRLGIAGGPVDKSWLVIRAMAAQRDGLDLDANVEKIFGAPPLLNEQIQLGGIDAIINNWNFVAQLEAKGYRKIVGAEEAANELGIKKAVPLLGYVFSEKWAAEHKADVLGLIEASRQAKNILAESEEEWRRLQPMMKAPDDATYEALRDGFRAGIPRTWGDAERADAAVYRGDVLGPLHGVPVTIKENVDQRGQATSNGVPAFADLGYQAGQFPHAEQAADEVLSLPMFPEITAQQIEAVCAAVGGVAGAALRAA